jgi:hypothetical protein
MIGHYLQSIQTQQNTLFLYFKDVLQCVLVIQGICHQVNIYNCKGKEVIRPRKVKTKVYTCMTGWVIQKKL